MHQANLHYSKWILRIITLLTCCCISTLSFAQTIQLSNNPPSRYVVKKGDTLWDISAKFLKDPWQWKSVWQQNSASIKNPHLIYPGDVVILQMVDGFPSLSLLRESVAVADSSPAGQRKQKLSPTVIVEPIKAAPISTIPLGKIAPFLKEPLVVEKADLSSAPRIIAGPDDRVILGPGTKIYLRNLPDQAALDWHVYRRGGALIDPDTKTPLGYEAVYLGDASVTQYGDPASATITKAKQEILVDDRLSPKEKTHPIHFLPAAPEHAVKGRIMHIYGGVGEAGPGSIVTINRGKQNGIEVGHVLAIERKGRMAKDKALINAKGETKTALLANIKDADKLKTQVRLPDERVGLMMVFRTFEHVAYGLIMQATDPVHTLDSISNP